MECEVFFSGTTCQGHLSSLRVFWLLSRCCNGTVGLAVCKPWRSVYFANQQVHHRSAQAPVTKATRARHLRLFNHIVYSDMDDDHTHALNASIDDLPKGWRWQHGHPVNWHRSQVVEKLHSNTTVTEGLTFMLRQGGHKHRQPGALGEFSLAA